MMQPSNEKMKQVLFFLLQTSVPRIIENQKNESNQTEEGHSDVEEKSVVGI
jgi:hypothetical protein